MISALIFAGGTGKRMNSRSKPKQFLEMQGKPIIIYTLEHFERCDEIDAIYVVCLADKIDELQNMIKKYDITKVKKIISGGATGHESIYNGILAMHEEAGNEDIVLLHDGVRPLIDEDLIIKNIESVRKYGNGITVEPAKESVAMSEDGFTIQRIPPRQVMYTVKAPQSFFYKEIECLYERAKAENILFWDAASMCNYYNMPLHMVLSSKNNIKITEPADYYIYRALYEVQEEQQIFGI